MSQRPPVKDWATDFDHLDQRWVNDPFPIWDDMRKRCPIAHTDRFMGVYFPSRYEDVRAVAYDTEHFSSRRIIVRETPPPRIPAPPITSDPPEHRPARMVLLPPFTPDAMKKLEPRARALANELIDKFATRGSADAAVEYAQEIPVRLIAHMLGLPEADGDLYRKWIKMVLEDGITDVSIAVQAAGEMTHYFMDYVQERTKKPGDDLISYLINGKANGQPLSPENVIGSLRLLLIAGIDTTWSGIGSCIWHLAKHARGSPPPGCGAGADADRHRGVPARLRASDDGARGGEGDRDQRLHVQARADGAAVLPGRQPRPRDVPGRRQGDHRPQGEPPRRLRPRHPPLRRLEPGAPGDDGGGGGAA